MWVVGVMNSIRSAKQFTILPCACPLSLLDWVFHPTISTKTACQNRVLHCHPKEHSNESCRLCCIGRTCCRSARRCLRQPRHFSPAATPSRTSRHYPDGTRSA